MKKISQKQKSYRRGRDESRRLANEVVGADESLVSLLSDGAEAAAFAALPLDDASLSAPPPSAPDDDDARSLLSSSSPPALLLLVDNIDDVDVTDVDEVAIDELFDAAAVAVVVVDADADDDVVLDARGSSLFDNCHNASN